MRDIRVPILVLVLVYGGWLVVALTGLFWSGSSGARFVGVLLLFIAPVTMAYQGWWLYRRRALSPWHRGAALLSWLYLPALGALVWWALTRLPTPR